VVSRCSVRLAAAAMPRWKAQWWSVLTSAQQRLLPAGFNTLDGFSTLAPIVFRLDGVVCLYERCTPVMQHATVADAPAAASLLPFVLRSRDDAQAATYTSAQ
jgi:hypothetical protein